MDFHNLKSSFPEYLGDQPKPCGYRGCPVICRNIREYEKHVADVHGKTPTQIAAEVWDQALETSNLPPNVKTAFRRRESDTERNLREKWAKEEKDRREN